MYVYACPCIYGVHTHIHPGTCTAHTYPVDLLSQQVFCRAQAPGLYSLHLEAQGAEQSLFFHCWHICSRASNISLSGFFEEMIISVKGTGSLVTRMFQTLTPCAQAILMDIGLTDQSLEVVVPRRGSIHSSAACSCCLMQPSPASIKEWLASAFSIQSLVAELELFAP